MELQICKLWAETGELCCNHWAQGRRGSGYPQDDQSSSQKVTACLFFIHMIIHRCTTKGFCTS